MLYEQMERVALHLVALIRGMLVFDLRLDRANEKKGCCGQRRVGNVINTASSLASVSAFCPVLTGLVNPTRTVAGICGTLTGLD